MELRGRMCWQVRTREWRAWHLTGQARTCITSTRERELWTFSPLRTTRTGGLSWRTWRDPEPLWFILTEVTCSSVSGTDPPISAEPTWMDLMFRYFSTITSIKCQISNNISSQGFPQCSAGLAQRTLHGLRSWQTVLVRRSPGSYSGRDWKFLNNSTTLGVFCIGNDGNTIKVVSAPEKDYRFIAASWDLSQQGGADWFLCPETGGLWGGIFPVEENNCLPIN